MEIRDMVQDYLECNAVGKENAVTSRVLKQVYGIKGSAVRRIIHDLRVNGLAVCSDNNGYYIAKSEEELVKAINNLQSRVNGITEALEGLKKCEVMA